MTTVEIVRAFKVSVGPEIWIACIALVAGAVTRAVKAKISKRAAPLVAIVTALVVSLPIAALIGEPLPGAVADAVAAAGLSVASHQLARMIVVRFFGEDAATALLGKAIEPARK